MIKLQTSNDLCRYWSALELVKQISILSFLEIGPGEGIFLKKLAENGYHGKGIDASDEAVQISSALLKGYQNVSVEKAALFEIKEKFDLIIMLQVLEHFENDLEPLLKIRELLNKKGYFIFSIPAHKRKWGYLDLVGGHYRRYERKQLTSLLAEAGFEILQFYSIGFPIVNATRIWEEHFYKKYYLKHNLNSKTLKENTLTSGYVDVPWVMTFPSVFKLLLNEVTLLPFFYIQMLFYNTDLGENYLALARSQSE